MGVDQPISIHRDRRGLLRNRRWIALDDAGLTEWPWLGRPRRLDWADLLGCAKGRLLGATGTTIWIDRWVEGGNDLLQMAAQMLAPQPRSHELHERLGGPLEVTISIPCFLYGSPTDELVDAETGQMEPLRATWRHGGSGLRHLPSVPHRRLLAARLRAVEQETVTVRVDSRRIRVRTPHGTYGLWWRDLELATATKDGLVLGNGDGHHLLLPWSPELDRLADVAWQLAWTRRHRRSGVPVPDRALSPAEPLKAGQVPATALSPVPQDEPDGPADADDWD